MERTAIGARLRRLALSLPVVFSAMIGPAWSTPAAELPFKQFRLPNGLTVLVHEDHAVPLVSIGVWYRVGSADEPTGRSGFAHLFEHLMFYGSEHYDGSFIDAMHALGGSGVNGTTSLDHTVYYETVPTEAVDRALWLESDRMGHLLGALTQQRLDTQRGVVENERRQRYDMPLGRTWSRLLRHVFPANHPYHRDPLGLSADLAKASLDDVKTWFRDHYGAANAVLVLAGDITPDEARNKAMTYFADVAPGPEQDRQQPWFAPLDAPSRSVMHDHVAQRRVVRAWPAPEAGSPSGAALALVADVLGGDRRSLLHRRLVETEHLASEVSAELTPMGLAGVFVISVAISDDADVAAVERVLDDELRRFVDRGPSVDDLHRALAHAETEMALHTESLSARGEVLARGLLQHDDPWASLRQRQLAVQLTPAHVAREAVWLLRPAHTLHVLPAEEGFDGEAEDLADEGRVASDAKPASVRVSTDELRPVTGWSADRRQLPAVGEAFPEPRLPALERARLPNGAEVILAPRRGTDLVHVRFLFDGGTAAEQRYPPGTAPFAMSMLREGATTTDSREVQERENWLGVEVSDGCDTDTCFLDLAVPRRRFADAVALAADTLRHPTFLSADIARRHAAWLSESTSQETDAYQFAADVMSRLLYGEGHPYAALAPSIDAHPSMAPFDSAVLHAYHGAFIRPDNVRVVVVGDVSLAACIDTLAAVLGDWTAPPGPVPLPSTAVAVPEPGEVAYLIDRPGAGQSHIAIGMFAPPAGDDVALGVANMVFWGASGSRLDNLLRDTKGWSYGVESTLAQQRGPRPLLFQVPVQTDRTGDAIDAVRSEVAALVDNRTPLAEEAVDATRMGVARSIVGMLESGDAMLANVSAQRVLGRSDDFWQRLPTLLRQTNAAAANSAIQSVLSNARMTWLIMGDRSVVEGPLRQRFPSLRLLDADGRAID
ncbi:insulinase family protein [Luteibacter flocculans]|uniref:Insulinase family protein n=1 Tax=Luteibacter flocculans TaxID=2780091 RepID=A0ABY4T2K3_9GAMM|nr:pitrilysin family protein [Luteibacter flocculans]URL58317.1 insulinase family protein [Luteibacter flocculans]